MSKIDGLGPYSAHVAIDPPKKELQEKGGSYTCECGQVMRVGDFPHYHGGGLRRMTADDVVERTRAQRALRGRTGR